MRFPLPKTFLGSRYFFRTKILKILFFGVHFWVDEVSVAEDIFGVQIFFHRPDGPHPSFCLSPRHKLFPQFSDTVMVTDGPSALKYLIPRPILNCHVTFKGVR